MATPETTPEVVIHPEAQQLEPTVRVAHPHLSLVRGGLAKVFPVAERLTGSEQTRRNLAFLDKHGAKIAIDTHGGRVAVSVDGGQGALICSLLRALEVSGLKHFPGSPHVPKEPDIYEAMGPFLLAKKDGRAEIKFGDGKLALGYISPQGYDDYRGEVFVENRKGSESNGLSGAPEEILGAALATFDLAELTAEIERPLAWRQAQGPDPYGLRMPGNSSE